MSWVAIILQLLKLVNWMISKAEQEKWMNEGERRQIARASVEVLRKQEFARDTLKDIERLSDDDVDGLLRDFGRSPEAGDSKR